KPLKKSPPLNPCKLSFCPIFREYRKPYSASKKIHSSFGVKFYRTKPLNKKRHENNLSYLLYLNRSEERRVGKECRIRWSTEDKKKNTKKGGRSEQENHKKENSERG